VDSSRDASYYIPILNYADVVVLFRLFASLLKDHGPMEPNDSVIQHALEMCSTEAQVVICEAGGICKFLLQNLQFAVVDGYICLAGSAGKARQLARSRRQALLQNQQMQPKLNPPPQLKLNPPPFLSASVDASLPVTAPSAPSMPQKAFASTYRSLAGTDFPPSSRVISGLTREAVSELSHVPAYLSQPSASHHIYDPEFDSSAVVQTAQPEKSSNYNDNGMQKANGDSMSDNWKTVSKVTKLSSVVSDPKISSSDAIGELDDFLVPSVSEHSTNGVINATAINDITTEEKELQKQAYYTQSKNIPATSESEDSDEPSDDGSMGVSSSSESLADQDDFTNNEFDMVTPAELLTDTFQEARLAGVLDTSDAKAAETYTEEHDSALSVNAPEFYPAVNLASLISIRKSSPQLSAASRASSHSRPSSRAAMTSNKRVQTDDSCASELQQLTDSHASEVAGLQEQLSLTVTQMQVSTCEINVL